MLYNSELTIKQKVNTILTLYRAMRNDLYHADIDEYRTVTYETQFLEDGESIDYSIEINEDYAIIIYRNHNTLSLSDTLYGLVKDLFIPLRNKFYEYYDNKPEDDEDFFWDNDDNLKDCSDPHYYDEISLNFA